MASIKETPFTAWEFTDDEAPIAANLPDLNYKFIQNELAVAATERAVKTYDSASTIGAQLQFQMEMEYLRGKIDILSYLLTCSDDCKNEAIALLVRNAEAQKQE